MIESAFSWNTERVAPEPTREITGSGTEIYIAEFARALRASDPALDRENLNPGQSYIPKIGTVWRTHSIFEPVTGCHRSVDTLLNRSNENLEVRTYAEVERILFEGDQGVPNWLMEQDLEDQEEEQQVEPASNIARCVHFLNAEVACIRRGGRIYISAGAFLTPAILIRSGIGPDGDRVANPHVGQHLSDKVAFLEVINFDPEKFDMAGEISFGNIASVGTRRCPFQKTYFSLVAFSPVSTIDSKATITHSQALRFVVDVNTCCGRVMTFKNRGLQQWPWPLVRSSPLSRCP